MLIMFNLYYFITFAYNIFLIMDTENIQILANLVSNVCFPIACCFCLFWFIVNQNKELQKTIEKNTELLRELSIIIKEKIK